MSFGSSKPQTQTTEVKLSPEQRELLNLAMPSLKEFAANPPQLPSFGGTAPFDPSQVAGQNLALGAAPTQGALAAKGAGASDFLLGDVLYPSSNPALQQTIDASVRPITEQLTQNTLPAIRSEATQAGQFGGSRQGIAEGLASQGASRAAGDTAAKVATSGYTAGLDAMGKGLALLPSTQGAQLAPAASTSGVGDVRQFQEQRLIDEAMRRFNYEEQLPLLVGKELAGISGSIPGGSTTTTASTPQANPWATAIGGASLAASLFPTASTAASSLLPLLAFSDRRLKRDVRYVGEWGALPIYDYEIVGVRERGVMADEVRAVCPEAIFEVAGFLMVDYETLARKMALV